MQHALRLIALATALAAAPAARAELHTLTLEGRLAVAGSTRTAALHLLCEPDPDGGAMSLELWVPQANTLKDFDYDDFEGPDAAAGDHALSHVSVAGGQRTTEIAYPAAGWYSGEEPDTFVFGLSQRSHRKGTLATLLGAVDPRRTQLVWVQRGFDNAKHELRATFALSAATVKQIRDTVDVCLAPAAPSTRAGKRARGR